MSKSGDDDRVEQRRLRAKNLVLLLALIAFVVLIYVVSVVRMGGG